MNLSPAAMTGSVQERAIVPQATPKRSGRQPEPGSRFLSDVLADNIRSRRSDRRLSQYQLAKGMAALGHPWTDSIVGFVERGQRNVTIDELAGLALVLSSTLGDLLSPAGVGRRITEATERLDIGRGSLPARMAAAWMRGALVLGLVPSEERDDYDLTIRAADLPDPMEEAQEARNAWRDHLLERIRGRREVDGQASVRRSVASDGTHPEEGS
jgi:transcriptional regulator with XRE-family HTH domain